MTMVQSAYDVKMWDRDFKNMQKNHYPILICYNGRDHFVPTIPVAEKDFLAWKIHRELGSLLAATLVVAKECDRPGLGRVTASSLRAITNSIESNLPKISKKANSYYLTLSTKSSKTHRGPGVNPLGPKISGASAPSSLPQQDRPFPSTSAAGAVPQEPSGAIEEEEEEEYTGKGYKCSNCGVIKARKPDLRGHLWTVHKLGEPIVCNMGNCANKSFSHPSSLKQHIRTMHKGLF